MRETVRFQMNVPEVMALAYDEGKAVEGRFGPQILYTLQDDRQAYVELEVDAKRKELGIRKYEEFQVCKRPVRDGSRRGVTWEVERVTVPEFRQEPNTAPAQVGPSATSEHTAVTAPVQAVRSQTRLEDALKTVVGAIHATRAYAKEIGFEMPVFSAEDLRTMANTLMIQNGGGR